MLMAQVLNVKINIFGTLPGTSMQMALKKISNVYLSHCISTNNIIYLFSKIKTVVGSFLIKTVPFP